MPDRLSPLDVSFLYMEDPATPMHVGSVAVFQVPEKGFDHATLVRLIERRIALAPRYRQRVRWVPGRVANPVWVDDENFDISFHVRRSALPRPGSDAQLRELVARLMSRPLDRNRPLWETYLVEGLSGDRFAIISKSHHAMVDGVAAVDIAQVILDPSPRSRAARKIPWRPGREPSWAALVAGAVFELATRPTLLLDTARGALADVRATTGKITGAAGGLFSALRTAARPAPESALNVDIGQQRRYATARTLLDDYKRVRKAHGGTVNDVVLAVVSGALRDWLLTRGEVVTSGTTLRAMVPVSVRGDDDEPGQPANRVSSYLVDLPVGEPDPVVRLHRVSYAMRAHEETGRAVAATALVGLAGFAPPTLHAMGARVASGLSHRLFNLAVTNVPGPQVPLYAAGARMCEAYPVVPLAKRQAVALGLTSYDGAVCFGINADRDAMPDVDVLAQYLGDALAELVATVR